MITKKESKAMAKRIGGVDRAGAGGGGGGDGFPSLVPSQTTTNIFRPEKKSFKINNSEVPEVIPFIALLRARARKGRAE